MARATFHKVTSADGKALGSVQRVHRFGHSAYQAWGIVTRTGQRVSLGFFDFREEAEGAVFAYSRDAFVTVPDLVR